MSNLANIPVALVTPSMLRQHWLELCTDACRAHFAKAGYTVPGEVRISIGWPRGSHGKGKAIGQCWSADASADKHAEIFISPEIGQRQGADTSTLIVATIVHELVHATVGHKAGHRAPFKVCALAVGLEGKMTATLPGPTCVELAANIVRAHGPFPAGALNDAARKKQTTRLLKCECQECGYTVRVTKQWLDKAGAPICPGDAEGREHAEEHGEDYTGHGPMAICVPSDGEE